MEAPAHAHRHEENLASSTSERDRDRDGGDSRAARGSRLRATSAPRAVREHPDWSAPIQRAGFALLLQRSLEVDHVIPADGPAGEYAALELRRVGHAAMPRLDDADRGTLLTLAGDGPGNIRELGEVRIRGSRTLWAARRP